MRPKNAQSVLQKAKIPALLITNPVNILYLTGVEADPGFVLLHGKKFTLFVSELDRESAERSVRKGITVAHYEELEPTLKKLKRCGFEKNAVSVGRYGIWKRKFKNTKFVQTEGIVEEYRRTKDAEELRKFKKAQRITRQMIKRVPKALKQGMTEKELAWKLESWAHELGADGLSFDAIVGFGTHTSCPHHVPTNRKFIKGHLVQIDVGVRYQGYCADQSRVFVTGELTHQQKRVLKAVQEAKRKATKAVKPGVKGPTLDRIARDVLKKYDLEEYFPHTLGHAIGLEIHEDPRLSMKLKKVKLKKHEIVTIEPGVYIPGKFGMRLEDEIIV